jgi:hypothetical protein
VDHRQKNSGWWQDKEEGTGGGTPAARGVSLSPLCGPRNAEIQVAERRGWLCLPRWGPPTGYSLLLPAPSFSQQSSRTSVPEPPTLGRSPRKSLANDGRNSCDAVSCRSRPSSPDGRQWVQHLLSLITATTPRGIPIHPCLPDPSLPQIPEPHSLVCIYVVALLVTELGPQKVDCSITAKRELSEQTKYMGISLSLTFLLPLH